MVTVFGRPQKACPKRVSAAPTTPGWPAVFSSGSRNSFPTTLVSITTPRARPFLKTSECCQPFRLIRKHRLSLLNPGDIGPLLPPTVDERFDILDVERRERSNRPTRKTTIRTFVDTCRSANNVAPIGQESSKNTDPEKT